jgi:hypothetical protein
VHKVRINLARPEAEEYDEGEVADGDDIVRHTPSTLETPGAPGQAAVVRFIYLCVVEDGQRRFWVV